MHNPAGPTPQSPKSSLELRQAISQFHGLKAFQTWSRDDVEPIVKRFINTPQFFPVAIALLSKFPESLDRIRSPIGRAMRIALPPDAVIKLMAISMRYDDPSLIELTWGRISDKLVDLKAALASDPDNLFARSYDVFKRARSYTDMWAITHVKFDKYQVVLDLSREPAHDLKQLQFLDGTLHRATAAELQAYYAAGHHYIHSHFAFPPREIHEMGKVSKLRDSLEISNSFSMLKHYPPLEVQGEILPVLARLPKHYRQRLIQLAEKLTTAKASFDPYKTLLNAIDRTPDLGINEKFLDDMNKAAADRFLSLVELYLELQDRQPK